MLLKKFSRMFCIQLDYLLWFDYKKEMIVCTDTLSLLPQAKISIVYVLPVQHSAWSSLSHSRRHKLHQLLHKGQTRCCSVNDGLPLCKMWVITVFYLPHYIIFFFITDGTELMCIMSGFCLSGIPCITDCVMAELEKLGMKYRVALR